jgi:hypothetical protein
VLKKTVTYENMFTGKKVTEDLYFNLDPAELAKMWMIGGETWVDHMQTLSQQNDGATIMEEFEKMLGTAYGERRDDKLVKTPTIREEFLSSQAYHTLFMELLMSSDNGSTFFSGLVPKNVEEIIAKFQKESGLAPSGAEAPPWVKENREPTQAELTSMTKEQLVEVMRRKNA